MIQPPLGPCLKYHFLAITLNQILPIYNCKENNGFLALYCNSDKRMMLSLICAHIERIADLAVVRVMPRPLANFVSSKRRETKQEREKIFNFSKTHILYLLTIIVNLFHTVVVLILPFPYEKKITLLLQYT